MVAEDTTAFVERLQVRLEHKRWARLRHQISAAELGVLESQSRIRAAPEFARALESEASDAPSVRRDLVRARPRVKAPQDFERSAAFQR